MNYLDTDLPITNFRQTLNDDIYVDKSMLIEKVSNNINKYSGKYICITRPRRFGKSINASMLGAYFTKGFDCHELFNHLKISKTNEYEKHLNKHHVIYIDFSRMPFQCDSFETYITSIYKKLQKDIYSQYHLNEEYDSPGDMLKATKDSFIFILDEWDSIFYKKFMSNRDKISFLVFLNDLLKNQPYVELAYMTGVLPIAKYSSGSALNMFEEYNFMNDSIYEDYFGFNEEEVKELCKTYLKPTYEELKYWYDGYKKKDGSSIFNPRSVSNALRRKECLNFWTETGPMNEIADCIGDNVDDVKEILVNLVSGVNVEEELSGYSATESNLKTKDEILSAMVVYGFLSYRDGVLKIPNHELMLKFQKVLKQNNMNEIADIVNSSKNMLDATIEQDAEAVAKYLEEVHDREIPFFNYNDENSLSCIITLCYLQARNVYEITREDKSGKGYVDFLFKPLKKDKPAIVLELKYDKSAEDAIQQIKAKNYIDCVRKNDTILLVGINYDSKTKEHTCIIEEYKK